MVFILSFGGSTSICSCRIGFEVRGEKVAVRLPLTGSFLSIVLIGLAKNRELLSCSDNTSDP